MRLVDSSLDRLVQESRLVLRFRIEFDLKIPSLKHIDYWLSLLVLVLKYIQFLLLLYRPNLPYYLLRLLNSFLFLNYLTHLLLVDSLRRRRAQLVLSVNCFGRRELLQRVLGFFKRIGYFFFLFLFFWWWRVE